MLFRKHDYDFSEPAAAKNGQTTDIDDHFSAFNFIIEIYIIYIQHFFYEYRNGLNRHRIGQTQATGATLFNQIVNSPGPQHR